MIACRLPRAADLQLLALLALVPIAILGVLWYESWLLALMLMLAFTWLVLGGRGVAARAEQVLVENRILAKRVEQFALVQGRFVGNIAHEIKTPLAVVIGEAEVLLLRSGDPVAVRSIGHSIIAEVSHLSDLVESFLHLAHPFTQGETSDHVPVYFGDVVIAAVARCRALSSKRNVRVLTVLAAPDNGDPSAEVLGDAVLLEVMVENLLRNALRFSAPGAQVDVHTTADRDFVGVVVRDHGLGIPIAQQQAVFDWFFDGPRRPSGESGAGFGLAITKRIVDHHGGAIVLRDTAGGGCEFEITLRRWWPDGEPPMGTPGARPAAPLVSTPNSPAKSSPGPSPMSQADAAAGGIAPTVQLRSATAASLGGRLSGEES